MSTGAPSGRTRTSPVSSRRKNGIVSAPSATVVHPLSCRVFHFPSESRYETVFDHRSSHDHSYATQSTAASTLRSGRGACAVPLSSTNPMKTPCALEVGRSSMSRLFRRAVMAPKRHRSATTPPTTGGQGFMAKSRMTGMAVLLYSLGTLYLGPFRSTLPSLTIMPRRDQLSQSSDLLPNEDWIPSSLATSTLRSPSGFSRSNSMMASLSRLTPFLAFSRFDTDPPVDDPFHEVFE